MPLPAFLFHATSQANASSIAAQGLIPRSGAGPAHYLCMSGVEAGAVTLDNRASDIIFRVSSASLTAAHWVQEGAGNNEWRSPDSIPAARLEYRRNLGTAAQRAWRQVTGNTVF